MGKIPNPTRSKKGDKVDWSDEMNNMEEQKPEATHTKPNNTFLPPPAQDSKGTAEQRLSISSIESGDIFDITKNVQLPESVTTSMTSGSPVQTKIQDHIENVPSEGFSRRTDHFPPVFADLKSRIAEIQQGSQPESQVKTPEELQEELERCKRKLVMPSQPKKLDPSAPAFTPAPQSVGTNTMNQGPSTQTNEDEEKKLDNNKDKEKQKKKAEKNRAKNKRKREKKKERAKVEQIRQELANIAIRNKIQYDPNKSKIDVLLEWNNLKAGGRRRNSTGNLNTNRLPEIPEDVVRTRRLSASVLDGVKRDLVIFSEDLEGKVYEVLEEKFGEGAE